MKNSENLTLKQQRREKQRSENLGRAQLMHELRKSGEVAEKKAPPELKQKYFIGCSGWYYRDWSKIFYPTQLSTSGWFNFYTQNFDTVELNAPFYSWPLLTTVKTWIRQAKNNPDFVYTIKVCELITHIKKFSRTKELVKDFGVIADMLDQKMGCFLYQLPPSFHYSKSNLEKILKQLEPSRRNVVEFRHKSWWNENVYDAFKKNNVIFCSSSGPKLPEELIKTHDEIYIRFHGLTKWYRHDYTADELKKWANWIHKSKAKKVWIYFNNDHDAYSIKNARELAKMLGFTLSSSLKL